MATGLLWLEQASSDTLVACPLFKSLLDSLDEEFSIVDSTIVIINDWKRNLNSIQRVTGSYYATKIVDFQFNFCIQIDNFLIEVTVINDVRASLFIYSKLSVARSLLLIKTNFMKVHH